METLETKYTQSVENIDDLLKSRWATSQNLNKEFREVLEKLRKHTAENPEVVLITIPFTEVTVTFGRQQMGNFFKEKQLPEGGLFLREIKFVLVQDLTDEGSIGTAIHIKFFFSDPHFNDYIALGNLGFNDEHARISEQVIGLGYDPKFTNKEKYQEVKKVLVEVRTMLNEKVKKHIIPEAK